MVPTSKCSDVVDHICAVVYTTSYVQSALLTGKCSGLMGLAVGVHFICTPQGGSQHTPLQTLQALSHGILEVEGINAAEAAAEAKRKPAEIKSANQASEVGLGLRTPMKRLSAPLLGVQQSARSHANVSVDVDLTSPSTTVCPKLTSFAHRLSPVAVYQSPLILQLHR